MFSTLPGHQGVQTTKERRCKGSGEGLGHVGNAYPSKGIQIHILLQAVWAKINTSELRLVLSYRLFEARLDLLYSHTRKQDPGRKWLGPCVSKLWSEAETTWQSQVLFSTLFNPPSNSTLSFSGLVTKQQ